WPLRRTRGNCRFQGGRRFLSTPARHPIRRRRSPLSFRLLVNPPRHAHPSVADACAFRKCNESRRISFEPPKSFTCPLSRTEGASWASHRRQTDVGVRRYAVVRGQGWT